MSICPTVDAACPVTEDLAWRDMQVAAGPAHQDFIVPENRTVRAYWVHVSSDIGRRLVWVAWQGSAYLDDRSADGR